MAAPPGKGVSGTSETGAGGGLLPPPLGVTVPHVGTQGVPTPKNYTGRLLGGLERRACTVSAETALLELGETEGAVRRGSRGRCECSGRAQRPGATQQTRQNIGVMKAWELLRQGVMGVTKALRQRVKLQHRGVVKDSETQTVLTRNTNTVQQTSKLRHDRQNK